MTNLRVILQNVNMAEEKKDQKEEKTTKSKPATSADEAKEEQKEDAKTTKEKAAAEVEEEATASVPEQEEQPQAELKKEAALKTSAPSVQSKLDTTTAEIPLELETEKSSFLSKKLILIILAVVIIGGLVGGGFLFLRARSSTTETGEEPTTKPESQVEMEEAADAEASPTASTTEAPKDEPTKVDLTDYSVQVLNGSGVAGEAGKVKDLLETEGFEKFDVGNADSYDYTDTEVRMKKDTLKEVFEKIKSAMEDYTVVEGDELEKEAENDVVVIVGQKEE